MRPDRLSISAIVNDRASQAIHTSSDGLHDNFEGITQ